MSDQEKKVVVVIGPELRVDYTEFHTKQHEEFLHLEEHIKDRTPEEQAEVFAKFEEMVEEERKQYVAQEEVKQLVGQITALCKHHGRIFEFVSFRVEGPTHMMRSVSFNPEAGPPGVEHSLMVRGLWERIKKQVKKQMKG